MSTLIVSLISRLFIYEATSYICPPMWIFDLIDRLIDKAPGLQKIFKTWRFRRKQNKKARVLWPELKDFVLDMKHYFETEKTVSFYNILKGLGMLVAGDENLKAQASSFRQLHERATILAGWFFSMRREMEIDIRKPDADTFSWKVFAVSSFLSDVSYHLVTDLNNLLQDKTYLNARGMQNDYSTLKDGYNLGLIRWETFLRKCNRDILSVQPKYFVRLE